MPYDDPPASTPRTRRQRLRRAILGTNELAQEVVNMTSGERQGERLGRRSTVGGLTRRRRRSSSEHDELSTSTPEGDERPRRSAKRRRLNAGNEAPAKKAIKYGYYGQVEPGKLRLELVSCDGGQHVDSRHPETSLGPENLLRHDRSVYCSELPQSNIILKHADDTPFCLEKLHVVGPELGFTAPVRAGIAYVAMTMEDLQKYVDPDYYNSRPPYAQLSRRNPNYHRQFRRRQPERSQSPPELLTVAEALRDPYINAAHSSRLTQQDSAYDSDEEAEADVYCDPSQTSDWLHGPTNSTSTHRTQPTTTLSDEDAGPEESSPQEVLDYRSQRERMMRRRYDIENWHRTREAGAGTFERITPHAEVIAGVRLHDREETLPLSRLIRRAQDESTRAEPEPESTDDDMPGLVPASPPAAQSQPQEPESAHQQRRFAPWIERPPRYCSRTGLPLSNMQSASASPHTNSKDNRGADDGVTIAKFRLARDKYKVAIKFDPPVSGRFVMLKLWAGAGSGDGRRFEREREFEDGGGGNVDVQSVVAKGWMGGMRFFPSLEMK